MLNKGNANLHDALDQFGVAVTAKMRANILVFGFNGAKSNRRINTTGGLADSFYFTISTDLTNGSMKVGFWSEKDYAMIVHDGRRAGKFAPPDKIEQWFLDKPLRLQKITINKFGQKVNKFAPRFEQKKNGDGVIDNLKSAVFAINKKIKEDGTEAKPYAKNAVDLLWPKMIQPIGIATARDLQQIIIDDFRASNYKIAAEQRWQTRPIY